LHALSYNQLKQASSHNIANDISSSYESFNEKIYEAVFSACQWLIRNGFLEEINPQGFFTFSKKGSRIKTFSEFQAFISSEKEAASQSKMATDEETIANISYNFPKIKLSSNEQQWLGTICQQFLKGYLVDVDRLKRSWHEQGKWPKGFRPSEIDSRLLQKGNKPTLLGIWHAYPVPKNKWIDKFDQLVRYVKERISNSTSKDIKVTEIAKAIGVTERSVSVLIHLLTSMGFYYSATVAPIRHDIVRIPGELDMYASLHLDDPEKMDDYLSYENMEKQITKVFGESEALYDTLEDIVPPVEIHESLRLFKADHPDPRKVAFIMMRFGNTKAHTDIVTGIQNALNTHGITAVRADDKQYHDDLFPNVLTYVYGCAFGIAIFERIETEEFNPNVALEVGYMFALKKSVCLLKDKTLKTLQADLVGKLYRVFDPLDPIKTIPGELSRWLQDKRIISSTVSSSGATSISISLKNFIPNSSDLILGIDAFATFSDLLHELCSVFLRNVVKPHTYGTSWVLVDSDSRRTIKNSRMISGEPPGKPALDLRTLEEVGIKAGMSLEAIVPEGQS
jgi:hypothetical protein